MTLHIKPKRHECTINGCRNKDSFIISKSPEHINSVYQCGEDIINIFVLFLEFLRENPDKATAYYDLLHDERTLTTITSYYGGDAPAGEDSPETIATSDEMYDYTKTSGDTPPADAIAPAKEARTRPAYPPARKRKAV